MLLRMRSERPNELEHSGSVDFASKMGSADSQRDGGEVSACISAPASGTRAPAEFEMRAEPDVAAAMQCCKGSEAASLAGEDEDEDEDEDEGEEEDESETR